MVVIGVIMFVSPIDDDTDLHLGVREVVMMDSINHTVFLRILDELPERHREQLWWYKHASFIITIFMEADQAPCKSEL
jgi:hypothetical protein